MVGVRNDCGRDGARNRVAFRWLLPAAGAIAAVLGGASHAWASGVTVTPTTAPGATTQSTLTWDVTPADPASTSCALVWDDGSGTLQTVAPAAACPLTGNPNDANEVGYALPALAGGAHAGSYALVAYEVPAGTPVDSSTPAVTSAFTHVAPVTPTIAGPTGTNLHPSWTVSGIDPEGTVTCTATTATVSFPATCSATPDGSGQDTVSTDLSSATQDATVTVSVSVTAHAETATASTSYALDVTAPSAPTFSPADGSSTDRTPTITLAGVEPGATVDCSLTAPDSTAAPASMITSCGSSAVKLDLTGGSYGTYTLAVTLTDAAGNARTTSTHYTLRPPVPTVTAPASPATDPTAPTAVPSGGRTPSDAQPATIPSSPWIAPPSKTW